MGGWNVISETPAAAKTPPAASSSSSAWNVVGETPASGSTPPSSSGGLGEWAERNLAGTEDEQAHGWGGGAGSAAAGFVKSAGQVIGTLLDLTGRTHTATQKANYKLRHPGATDEQAEQDYQQSLNGRIVGHMQDAANWLRSGSEPQGFWEHVGAIGEQVLEYVGTEGLLKMAGAPLRAAGEAGKAVDATEATLKSAQQVATTLKANPKLAGLVAVGLKASKDAALMAGQTYLHTEDPTQAAVAGAFGGAVSGMAGGAMNWLEKNAPKNLTIAGVKIPALATQTNEAGLPSDTGAEGAPKVARGQQEGAQNVIRNTAAQATASAIDKINAGRLPTAEGAETLGKNSAVFRMEPAADIGEVPNPAHSKLEGPSYREQRTQLGTTAETIPESVRGDRTPARTRADKLTSSTEKVMPKRAMEGPPTVRESLLGMLEGAGGERTGAGLQTDNPAIATAWASRLDDAIESPGFSSLPEKTQTAFKDARQALQEQLGMYHASSNFAPYNTFDAVSSVRTFGDAAAQVHAAAKPVYETLDQLSGGQFHTWDEVASRQLKIMRNPSSEEAYQSAATKYQEAQKAIEDLINGHRGRISEQDYLAAKNAWRDGSRLNELHNVFEGMMNGVTMEESDRGLTRVMTGNAKHLQAYLAEGSNQAQLEQLIGKDGLFNLKQMTVLLSRANTARDTMEVARNVLSQLYGHARVGGAGGALGGLIAHSMGQPWFEGMILGATAAEGARMVLRYAATSPRVGNMVEYAVRNGLSPQHYAPLIARAIAEPLQQPQESEGNSQESEGGKQ